MRLSLLFLVACGLPTKPYGDSVSAGTACVTVEGVELCAATESVIATRTADGFVVEAVVDVPDREIGYDQATLRLESDSKGKRFAALAPLAVDCMKVAAHGDHCHPDVEAYMSCSLDVGPSQGELTIDRLDDNGLYARFEAEVDIERPDCCRNDCDFSTTAVASPSGPYRITGVVHVEFGAEGTTGETSTSE
jgi:hypothetical protein